MRKVRFVLLAVLGLLIMLSPAIQVMAQGSSNSIPQPAPPPPLDIWWIIGVLIGLIP
jgi:hypothetical protein